MAELRQTHRNVTHSGASGMFAMIAADLRKFFSLNPLIIYFSASIRLYGEQSAVATAANKDVARTLLSFILLYSVELASLRDNWLV